MIQYTQFLNAIGTYLDLLELDAHIQLHQKMMDNNKDEIEVYQRLKNRKDSYQQEKDAILENNPIENGKEILSMWGFVQNYLLDNPKELNTLYSSKKGRRELPVYALCQEIVKYDIAFYDMYCFLIHHNLYNPNFEYGFSDEPFFTMLPIDPIEQFYQINQMVVAHPETNFHILRNGSDVIEWALHYLSTSKDTITRDYWENYIMTAIKGNCSLLDSKRYHGVFSLEVKPSIFCIMQHSHLESIHSYLLSEQGICKQIENALYPSLERDKAIDFYIERIEDTNIKKKLYRLKTQAK